MFFGEHKLLDLDVHYVILSIIYIYIFFLVKDLLFNTRFISNFVLINLQLNYPTLKCTNEKGVIKLCNLQRFFLYLIM